MTHVSQLLLTSMLQHEIDVGWQVEEPHLFLIEVPVLLGLGVERHVGSAVPGAAVVGEPDIVAGICKHEGGGNGGIV